MLQFSELERLSDDYPRVTAKGSVSKLILDRRERAHQLRSVTAVSAFKNLTVSSCRDKRVKSPGEFPISFVQ